jgi:hypothetical protein
MRMSRTLPEKIVAVVEGLAEDLADWCVAGRDRTLAEHEEAVLERVRAVLPLLLRAVVEQATSGLDVRLVRAREACPGCGRQVEPHGRPRRRQLATQCGPVTLERPWYHCWSCGAGWSVVETTLGVASGTRVSEGLRGWLVRLGAAAPFREAAEVLDALTGLELGAETIRRHAEAAAVLRRERGSCTTNAERMDDPARRLEGLPSGSGASASAADQLVQRRMKRAGLRWSDPGGDAILALRARLRSKRPLTLPSARSRPAPRPRSAAAA